jgi:hypothetical protein
MDRLDHLLLGAVALAAAWSCGSDEKRVSQEETSGEAHAAATPVASVNAPDLCELIPLAEVERLIGPIEGRPKREANGCWYSVPMDAPKPEAAAPGAFDPDRRMPFEDPRRGLFVEVDLVKTPLERRQAAQLLFDLVQRAEDEVL